MNNWISVEDRLPEFEDEVIVYGVREDGRTIVTCIGFENGRFTDWESLQEDAIWNKTITHWQPLPEPPEETK